MHLCYFISMNTAKCAAKLAAEVRQHFAGRGITSSTAIAKVTGVPQSQVYRNLFGRPKRISKTLRELCCYANISLKTALPAPASSPILMDALAKVWDGSDDHARRLAALLFAHQRASV
jgi:hypothetical protein